MPQSAVTAREDRSDDWAATEELLRIKQALRQTVLFITHSIQESIMLSDREPHRADVGARDRIRLLHGRHPAAVPDQRAAAGCERRGQPRRAQDAADRRSAGRGYGHSIRSGRHGRRLTGRTAPDETGHRMKQGKLTLIAARVAVAVNGLLGWLIRRVTKYKQPTPERVFFT